MSIIGGAVVPVIQGLVSDSIGSMQVSFAVNIVCFGAVLLYFLTSYRRGRPAAADASARKDIS